MIILGIETSCDETAAAICKNGEIISTLVGTSILSYGHIRNQKLCKLCCH